MQVLHPVHPPIPDTAHEHGAPASACVELTKADVELIRDGLGRLPSTPLGGELYEKLDSLYTALDLIDTRPTGSERSAG